MAPIQRHAYLFILCPPFSGSTALWKFVATSSAVSALPGEGQFLPEVEHIMRKDPWNPDVEFPWDTIKQVWHRYWDLTKPWLIEKSPPNLVRAREIARCFDPAYFLVMVRNPYAHCASLMRRSGWEATRAASFSVDCLRRQADNAKVLQNVVRLTYEGFANDSKATARAIQAALPGIGSFDCEAAFEIHSSLAADGRAVVAQGIVNHNAHAFETLSPADVEQIGAVLSQHSQVLQYWGYEHCEPRRHDD